MFFIFLFLVVVGVVLYFILFSPQFQVTAVEIYGNEKVKSEDIEGLIVLAASNRIFLINRDKLQNKILSKFPAIESAVVKKKFPHTIVLTVKEREIFMTFCTSQKLNSCFHMDMNGIIFEPSQDIPVGSMIVIKKPDGTISLGTEAVGKNIIVMISRIENDLKSNFQIGVKEAVISNYLIIKTSEGWQIYFDPTADIDLQIAKINILLKDKISPEDRKKIQYIYLQYQDRAYYK